MCGILIHIGSRSSAKLVERLVDALHVMDHRGPDNTQYYDSGDAFLGHNRLSILDTKAGANQPFFFDDLVLVYNGEVFNYLELRVELVRHGYTFQTDSDTEVVIKAFHLWGNKCFNEFNGMWALAIYNLKTKALTICRDRFGQKPLFFHRSSQSIVFASELQALSRIVTTKPNYNAISSFLKEGDFAVQGGTFFDGIFEVPASCSLSIGPDLKISIQSYWKYPDRIDVRQGDNENFHSLLEDSVRLRMRSDVGYSLLLSGGCDSTIVAGIMRGLVGRGQPLSAFTYSSGDQDDELSVSMAVAKALDYKLHVVRRSAMGNQYISRLSKLVRHMGRGHSSPAIVPIDFLYESVRQNGDKVALDGQGADEMLGGYKFYHFHLFIDLLLAGEWKQLKYLFSDFVKEGVVQVSIMAMRNSLPESFRKFMRIAFGYEKLFSRKVIGSSLNPLWDSREVPQQGSYLNEFLIKQHRNGLANLLYYGDIVAMASSVENRSPFLDHRLVELAFSSGFKLKVDEGVDKAVLRKHPIYREFRKVLDRRKIGFSSAIEIDVKAKMVDDLTQSPILNWPIFDGRQISKFVNGKSIMHPKFERFLFRLYQVHLWEEEFIGSAGVRTP
jgi:asparagine synthase (glutamine-hydrolysing)